MKTRLLAREGEHWKVWTKWYDARLDPSHHIPCYSPPDLELEEARVLLPDELWEQGPAAVNARIKALFEESGCASKPAETQPAIPEQALATIEVEWEGERLIMRRRPVMPEDMPDETLLAALQALRQQLQQTVETLQAEQFANAIDPRIIEELRQVVELLPADAPVDMAQTMQLAMQVDEVREYLERMSDDEAAAWPEILRHKVHTQVRILHAFLDSFRVWEVLHAPESQELTEEEIQAAPRLAEDLAQELEELGDEHAELAIPRNLRSLRQRLLALLKQVGSVWAAARERAADLIKSSANVIKAIAQWLLARARTFRGEFTRAADKEARHLALWSAGLLRRLLQGGMLAGLSGAGGFVMKQLGWLPAVLEWLRQVAPWLF